jgi:hypothetical protein
MQWRDPNIALRRGQSISSPGAMTDPTRKKSTASWLQNIPVLGNTASQEPRSLIQSIKPVPQASAPLFSFPAPRMSPPLAGCMLHSVNALGRITRVADHHLALPWPPLFPRPTPFLLHVMAQSLMSSTMTFPAASSYAVPGYYNGYNMQMMMMGMRNMRSPFGPSRHLLF